jgi:hypothetical protein
MSCCTSRFSTLSGFVQLFRECLLLRPIPLLVIKPGMAHVPRAAVRAAAFTFPGVHGPQHRRHRQVIVPQPFTALHSVLSAKQTSSRLRFRNASTGYICIYLVPFSDKFGAVSVIINGPTRTDHPLPNLRVRTGPLEQELEHVVLYRLLARIVQSAVLQILTCHVNLRGDSTTCTGEERG